jgi:hypothetical protein
VSFDVTECVIDRLTHFVPIAGTGNNASVTGVRSGNVNSGDGKHGESFTGYGLQGYGLRVIT